MRVHPLLFSICMLVVGLIAAPVANAQGTGGAGFSTASSKRKAVSSQAAGVAVFPGAPATIGEDGLAVPPAGAPGQVVAAIEAANRIVGKPYKWGGGHAKVQDSGYDCSGTVSYALIRAGLLTAPMVSGTFARWGSAGAGRWTAIYANKGHVYMEVAGLRLDTSAVGDPIGGNGVRWRPLIGKRRGFHVRHVTGL